MYLEKLDHLGAHSAFPCRPLVLTKAPPVSKEELVHLDGEVILIAKGGNFRVKLDNGHEVLAKLAGKVRRHRIRVVLGDRHGQVDHVTARDELTEFSDHARILALPAAANCET